MYGEKKVGDGYYAPAARITLDLCLFCVYFSGHASSSTSTPGNTHIPAPKLRKGVFSWYLCLIPTTLALQEWGILESSLVIPSHGRDGASFAH
jgi:hypothetical protein